MSDDACNEEYGDLFEIEMISWNTKRAEWGYTLPIIGERFIVTRTDFWNDDSVVIKEYHGNSPTFATGTYDIHRLDPCDFKIVDSTSAYDIAMSII